MVKADYFWYALLTSDDEQSEDEIVREALLGKGRLYCFSRAEVIVVSMQVCC